MAKSVASSVLLAGVRAYQVVLSPYLPPSCRYVPTCSQYMAEAIREWGPAEGLRLGVQRVCRCHPWSGSGYDPVPKKTPTDNAQTD